MSRRVAAPVYEPYRLTIPAREALERAGNRVELLGNISVAPPYTPGDALPPSARPALTLVAWYERGQWVPCPQCGGALVWYEACYVPGYRICVERQHHAQLSHDGSSASHSRRSTRSKHVPSL